MLKLSMMMGCDRSMIEVLERKWKDISMDFVQGLPISRNKHNVILIMVDKLTNVAHFIPRNLTNGTHVIAQMFIQEVFRLHGILEKIIFDKDARVTSRFW